MLYFIKRLLFALKESINPYPELYPIHYLQEINIKAIVNEYLNFNRKIAEIAKANHGKHYIFLQPINGFGKRQLSPFDYFSIAHLKRFKNKYHKSQFNYIEDFYSEIDKKTINEKNFFNLKYIFDDYKNEIYFDHVHLSDIGYSMVAEKIAKKILEDEND